MPRAGMPPDTDPLLMRILEEPEMAELVAERRFVRLYDRLLARRGRAKDPTERAALDDLLSDRLEFMDPVANAPRLFALNLFGTKLMGASDGRRDRTYVATLFFVVLLVPLWPIADYVVERTGPRHYTFFGKVPLRSSLRAWRRAATWAAAIGALALVERARSLDVLRNIVWTAASTWAARR